MRVGLLIRTFALQIDGRLRTALHGILEAVLLPLTTLASLRKEVHHIEGAVRRLIKTPLTVNQFSAICSWGFNVGSGNVQNSTLRMKLNRGDVEGAADEFRKWRKAGGRVLAGLVRRRVAERALFLTAD